MASVNASCTAAPVELLRFKAQALEDKVLLDWATAQEINNHYFSIERSSDGISFASIGRVEGNGTASLLQEYFFTETKPLPGKNYYRLAQYDFDGTVHYSAVVSVEQQTTVVSVGPIPFSSFATLLVQSAGERIHFRLTDLQGKQLEDAEIRSGEEVQIGRLLPSGWYLLEITQPDNVYRQKILKE